MHTHNIYFLWRNMKITFLLSSDIHLIFFSKFCDLTTLKYSYLACMIAYVKMTVDVLSHVTSFRRGIVTVGKSTSFYLP